MKWKHQTPYALFLQWPFLRFPWFPEVKEMWPENFLLIIPFGDCRMHFYTLFPTNFTKQLETAHHQLKKVITHIETKYQCLLTSVMTFRLTCHVTEFGGPSSMIWHDSELPSQVFPYKKKKQYNSFQHDNLLWRKKITYLSITVIKRNSYHEKFMLSGTFHPKCLAS